jgi:tetratricopeptide (TPR) repeat protein
LTNTLLKDYPMDEAGAMSVVEVAAALRESGQMDTAMGLYEYAMGIAKGTKAEAMARAGRAQVWVTQGKDEDVKAEVNRIIADANSLPGADEAVFVIGEEYYCIANKAIDDEAKREAYQNAIDMWEKCISTNHKSSSSPQFYYFTAGALRRIGRYDEAIQYYEKVVSQWPECDLAWQAQLVAAKCYQGLKEQNLLSAEEADAKTIEAYKKLLKEYPNCPAARTASGQIAALSQNKDVVN